jgi:hypothetical protein
MSARKNNPDSTQLEMFSDAIRPATFRDEMDDRYDAAILDGCPRGMLALVSGSAKLPGIAELSDAILHRRTVGCDLGTGCSWL